MCVCVYIYIFNPGLLHCRQILYPLSHQGSIYYIYNSIYEAQVPNLCLPHLSPLVTISFFPYVYESICLQKPLSAPFFFFFYISQVSDIMWCLSSWLTLFSTIIFRSICVAANGTTSFLLWLSNILLHIMNAYMYVCAYICIHTHVFFHSLMDVSLDSITWVL